MTAARSVYSRIPFKCLVKVLLFFILSPQNLLSSSFPGLISSGLWNFSNFFILGFSRSMNKAKSFFLFLGELSEYKCKPVGVPVFRGPVEDIFFEQRYVFYVFYVFI